MLDLDDDMWGMIQPSRHTYQSRLYTPGKPKYSHSLLPNELGFAEVYVDDKRTRVKVHVGNFTVDEILVTTADGDIVISGEHEDKEDEHGFISRSFTRRFHLPDNSRVDELRCDIDVNGVLTVKVPRSNLENGKGKVHVIDSDKSFTGKHPGHSGGFLGKMMSAAFADHEDLPTSFGVHKTKGHFTVRLELPHFTPEEISVKTIDDFLIVQGEHEEKEDGHGFISRSFRRKYHLPLNADKDQVKCTVTRKGILTVTVQRVNIERGDHEKVYKITTSEAAKKNCANCAK